MRGQGLAADGTRERAGNEESCGVADEPLVHREGESGHRASRTGATQLESSHEAIVVLGRHPKPAIGRHHKTGHRG